MWPVASNRTARTRNIPSSQGVPLDSLVLDAGVTTLPYGAYFQQEDSERHRLRVRWRSVPEEQPLREGDTVLTSDQMCQLGQRVGCGGRGSFCCVHHIRPSGCLHFNYLTVLLVNYTSIKLKKIE